MTVNPMTDASLMAELRQRMTLAIGRETVAVSNLGPSLSRYLEMPRCL
jgi:hypothetical protein